MVQATGGLADKVSDTNHAEQPDAERAGFTFEDGNAAGLESAVEPATGLWYKYPRHCHQPRPNGMRQDCAWNRSGGHCLSIFNHPRA